ncbi:MAG: hypothetical protein AAFY41_13905, partial [Bacteroidota bacterium]
NSPGSTQLCSGLVPASTVILINSGERVIGWFSKLKGALGANDEAYFLPQQDLFGDISFHLYKYTNDGEAPVVSQKIYEQNITMESSSFEVKDFIVTENNDYCKVTWSYEDDRSPELIRITVDAGTRPEQSWVLPGELTSFSYDPFLFTTNDGSVITRQSIALQTGYLQSTLLNNKVTYDTIFVSGKSISYNFDGVASDNTELAPITNFRASTNTVDEIALSWEYPVFAFSTFNIYRDGIQIATGLPTETRFFYDTASSLEPGTFYAYQVEAVYTDVNGVEQHTRKNNAAGKMHRNILVRGVVIDENANPLPGIRVSLLRQGSENSNELLFAYTDELGVYELESDILKVNTAYELKVFNPYTLAKSVTFSGSDLHHVDFRFDGTLSPYETQTDEELKVVHAKAYFNPFKNAVDLRWAVNTPTDQAVFELIKDVSLLSSDFKVI